MPRLRPLAPALAALALLLLPAGALANRGLQVGMADDRSLLADPAGAPALATQWKGVGIDTVRILVAWGTVAPAFGSPVQPVGFDAANPDSPGYDWSRVDAGVNAVTAQGMSVILAITGPGPLWSSSEPARGNQRWKPDPVKYGQFASAVAKRYGSKVGQYVVWNEPNQPLWLQPQFTCGPPGHCTPTSPAVYRALARAAIPAIKAADPGAKVYVPAVSPTGAQPVKQNAIMKPLTFLRALGCVTPKLKRDRTGPCRGFKPISADAIAYHPHGSLRSPTTVNPDPNEASLADLPRLERTIDAIQRLGGLKKIGGGRFPLELTEYGYQTDPPDPYLGVSPSEQSLWLQQAAYIAWRDPRVDTLVQYVWRDEPVGTTGPRALRYSAWQSGLLFSNGSPKPALETFPDPFWVDASRGRSKGTIWGQVRPGGAHAVTIQSRAPGAGTWTTVTSEQTDSRGYFVLHRPLGSAKARWRFTYAGQDGATVSSASMRAAVRRG
jgi:Cellulase (glycosyl hydrolase family 5)